MVIRDQNIARHTGSKEMTEENTKQVKIKFEKIEFRDVDSLMDFQGNLKTLSDENYEKFKAKILKLGFVEPVVVWENNILNGHQRIKTLTRMRDVEGYEIPKIPVAMVNATNKKEAKEMVLSLTSQFGKMSEESLMEFVKRENLDFRDVITGFDFAGIDLDKLDESILDDLDAADYDEALGEDLEDVDIQGEVAGKAEYLIITFDSKEEFELARERLELGNNIKRIGYHSFMEKMMGSGDSEVEPMNTPE